MAEVLVVRRLLGRKHYLISAINRPLKNYTDPFSLVEGKFINKYRLSKDAVRFLVQELTPYLHTASNGLSIDLQVLTVLRLLGSGSFQNVIGEIIESTQASVSRYMDYVINAIVQIAKKFITFPTSQQQITATRHRFFEKLGFPNVIGAIDCTHIDIQRPNKDDWFNFINRKGRFSINVQMICDADLNVIDLVARWPGSWHDAHIWNRNAARKLFEDGVIPPRIFLLGDSGYPLEPWLLTPFLNPCGPAEEIFNIKHRSARNVIERCFGVMKSRFRILSQSGGKLCYSSEKACLIIIAVAVLNNICNRFNVDLPCIDINDNDEDDNYEDDCLSNQGSAAAILIRQEIANRFQSAR